MKGRPNILICYMVNKLMKVTICSSQNKWIFFCKRNQVGAIANSMVVHDYYQKSRLGQCSATFLSHGTLIKLAKLGGTPQQKM